MSNIFFYDFFEAAYRDAKRAYPDLCHEHEKAWLHPAIKASGSDALREMQLIKSRFKLPEEYISHCLKQGVAIHPAIAVPIAVGRIPNKDKYEIEERDNGMSVREIYGQMFYEYELARDECLPRDKDYAIAVEFLDSFSEVDRPNIKPETLIRYRNLWIERLERKKLD
ncbi:hypothetical protein [Neptuniibacter sp. QD48_11]|uniref:hypothetical protein n=1 Tax=Neptuniibacter sp. QD48_11 TaxID=3398211 RepID=UPI0039F5F60B